MAVPNSRDTLKQYCLRKLGAPVIEINVADEQLEDRIDEALQKYQNYHMDATTIDYLSHVITQTDMTNGYLTLSDNIISVNRVFPVGVGSRAVFSSQYNLEMAAISTLNDFASGGLSNYVGTMANISSLRSIISPDKTFDFVRHENRLYVRTDWDDSFTVGTYLMLEIYRTLDMSTNTKIYNDEWLKKYTTALFKLQWGSILSKYENVQMLNGVTMNGTKIYEEAKEEIDALDSEVGDKYSLPPQMFIG